VETSKWTGWVGFAGWFMVIVGFIDAFQGLIAIIRQHYYVMGPNQVIIFNVKTWGWVMLIWGIIMFLAGMALLAGSGWARWFAIVVASLSFLVQLGFVGSAQYTLWALAALVLTGFVLYALIVKWHEAVAGAQM
jgi:hypothetical protein